MLITETLTDGLKREFKVVVLANDMSKSMDEELLRVGQKVRLDGFRQGKVPLPVLRQRYSQSVLPDVLEGLVKKGTEKALQDRGLKMAVRPKVDLKSFETGKDIEYTFAVEVLPQIEPGEFSSLQIEKPVAAIEDKTLAEVMDRLLKSQRILNKVDRAAQKGDILIIDFDGTSNGKALPGMKAQDFELELGTNMFVGTFEDQLVGAKTGDHRRVTVQFPDTYGNKELAGQPGVFEVDVKAVQESQLPPLDDELAKKFGAENAEDLKVKVRERVSNDYDKLSRVHMKKQLLDKLAEKHTFLVPQGMIDLEFDGIWQRLQQELKQGTAGDDKNKSEEELKKEYRAIAERRVRLGLLLAEVGFRQKIQVSQPELNQALFAEMSRYPGQERQVMDYFRNNPSAMDSLRGPLFEDKVVDYILSQAKVTEKKVSVDELTKDLQEDAE